MTQIEMFEKSYELLLKIKTALWNKTKDSNCLRGKAITGEYCYYEVFSHLNSCMSAIQHCVDSQKKFGIKCKK